MGLKIARHIALCGLLFLLFGLQAPGQDPRQPIGQPNPGPSPMIPRPGGLPAPRPSPDTFKIPSGLAKPAPTPAPQPTPIPVDPVCDGGACRKKTPEFYPLRETVNVDLGSLTKSDPARGEAWIKRVNPGQTEIKLEAKGLQSGTKYYLYAIDDKGDLNELGSVIALDKQVNIRASTWLDSFMLVLSPEPDLKNIRSATNLSLITTPPRRFTFAK